MIALLQRVSRASVTVENKHIGEIGPGLLVMVGVEPDDGEIELNNLLNKILGYRIFSDSNGKMNLSLKQTEGGLLLVPQFTLAAETKKGMRPGFSTAATPEIGEHLFNQLVSTAQRQHSTVEQGQFGADMQVSLVNDGPVTFILRSGKVL